MSVVDQPWAPYPIKVSTSPPSNTLAPAAASSSSSTTRRTSYPRKSRQPQPSPAPTAASASTSISTRSRRSRQSLSDGQSQNGVSPDKAAQVQNGAASTSSTPPLGAFSASIQQYLAPPDGGEPDDWRDLKAPEVSIQPRIRLTLGKKRKAVETEDEEGRYKGDELESNSVAPAGKGATTFGAMNGDDGGIDMGKAEDESVSGTKSSDHRSDSEGSEEDRDEHDGSEQNGTTTPSHRLYNGLDRAEVVIGGSKPSAVVHPDEPDTSIAMTKSSSRQSRRLAGGGVSQMKIEADEKPDMSMAEPWNEVVGSGGKDDVAMEERSVKRRRETISPPLTEPDEQPATKLSEKVSEEIQAAELQEAKRAPRKKRKWLKKGQVDPEDLAAVARQKERHTMIDQALENLDRQYEMVEQGSHPQLVEMLDELQKRRDIQLQRLDARHLATRNELTFIANHEDRDHMEEWRYKTTVAQDKLLGEVETNIRLLDREKTMFKRQAGDHAMPRSGRGGGGWMLFDKHLMSKKNIPLISTRLNGVLRTRRDISIKPGMLDPESIADDLVYYNVRQPKPRMPPPVESHSPKTVPARPAPAGPTEMKPPPIPSGSGSTPAPPPSNRPAAPQSGPPGGSGSGSGGAPYRNGPTLPGMGPPSSTPSRNYLPTPTAPGSTPLASGQSRHANSMPHGPINSLQSLGGYSRPPSVPNPTPFSSRATFSSGGGSKDAGEVHPRERYPELGTAPFFSSSSSTFKPSERTPTHAPAGARWGFSAPSSSSTAVQQSSHSSRQASGGAFDSRPAHSFGSSAFPSRSPATGGGSTLPPAASLPRPPAGPRSSTVIAGWYGDNSRSGWNGSRNPPIASSSSAPPPGLNPSSSSSSLPPPPPPPSSSHGLPPRLDEGSRALPRPPPNITPSNPGSHARPEEVAMATGAYLPPPPDRRWT